MKKDKPVISRRDLLRSASFVGATAAVTSAGIIATSAAVEAAEPNAESDQTNAMNL